MAYPPTGIELVTLAEVKSIANISGATSDTFINANIPTVCRAIETYCRRRFLLNNWIQWVSLERELLTDNWPIHNVLLLGYPYAVFEIADTGNIYNFMITQANPNNINIVSQFSATNTQTLAVTNFLFSTYTTIAALKTQVEATLSGVTFTYQTAPDTITFANLNTLSLRPTIGKTVYAGVNYFDRSSSTSLGDIYRISELSDRLIINPNYSTSSYALYSGNYMGPYTTGYNNIDSGYTFDYYNEQDTLLIYNSGWATTDVPQELKFVVASMIRDLMSLYDLDSSGIPKNIYKSESLGDYSYTLNDMASLSEILNRYASQLDYFKRKII